MAAPNISIDLENISIYPKLAITHEDLDLEFLMAKYKDNETLLKKKADLEDARKKINAFESQFKDKLVEIA